MKTNRVLIVVIDACGVGELPDAHHYGDAGASTIPNVATAVGGLKMPNAERLGLGNITPILGIQPSSQAVGCYGRMAEKSSGKDSTTGHWEIAGIILDKPFPLFPIGFPKALVDEFERQAGVKTIGNIAASGPEIIERFGKEQMQSGGVILYTSADSVFQLAAHEKIIPIDRLYEICAIARKLCSGEFGVGRVIARPFVGEPESFVRTSGRRDFSVAPPNETVLDLMVKNRMPTLAIGKIWDLFAERGISHHIKTADNAEGISVIVEAIRRDTTNRLIFANLVDFDQLWGHRNDEKSFAKALEEFDAGLGQMLASLREDDMLIITADHGCDPTQKHSTDHTREYVPLLVYGKNIAKGVNLGTRETFADIAATIGDIFDIRHSFPGRSFAQNILP
jgi:phosphopentomutase